MTTDPSHARGVRAGLALLAAIAIIITSCAPELPTPSEPVAVATPVSPKRQGGELVSGDSKPLGRDPTATNKPPVNPTAEPTRPATAEPTPTSAPQSIPTTAPSPTPAPNPVQPAEGYEIPAPAIEGLTPATVVEVIDGDTIKVEIDGTVYSLRYIGVDSPEANETDDLGRAVGAEATAANRALVEGRTVYLERDTNETDSFGRLLRYVWVDGVMVGAEMVRLGQAIAKAYPPDTRHHQQLEAIEAQARDLGVGMWAETGDRSVIVELPEETAPPPTAVPAPDGSIHIAHVAKGGNPEYVEICNGTQQDQRMEGWQLRSVRGDQWYAFPGDYVLTAGACVRIESASSAQEVRPGRLLWTLKNMWNNEESDPAELYDPQGSLVDTR